MKIAVVIVLLIALWGCGTTYTPFAPPTPIPEINPPSRQSALSLTPLIYLGAGMIAAGAVGAWITRSPTALIYGGTAGGGTITIASLYARYEWAVWVVGFAIVAATALHLYIKRRHSA